MLSLYLFFLSFSLIFSTISSSNHIHNSTFPSDVDAQALLDFKSNADPHNLLSFNSSASHCSWPGVQCSSSDDKVVHFVLENLPLGGVLSANSLTNLDQLRVLILQNNSLSGPIPDLSRLINLKSLFLHHNSFSGAFPPSVSSLHRLRSLDLSYNNLTGPIPAWLARLDRLGSLRLEFNRFNGSIPAINQSSLLKFNVSGNNLSGAVPVTSALAKFGPDSFDLNPSLCGEIVDRECHLKLPDGGVDLTHEKGGKKRRHSAIMILGFAIGMFVLIALLLCVAIKKREEKSGYRRSTLIEGVGVEAVAEVMRTEEEREEKVKTVEEGIKSAKSGSLMFFARGGDQPYTVEQLMRAPAELLGRGMVGTTYKAVVESGLMVCVKRVDGSKVAGAGREVFARHMELVGGLRHHNLVPLISFFHFQDKEERLLVYDYQPNGSLFSLIHGSKSAGANPLHWTSCLKIAEDVAQGLSYIHQTRRFVHGNLKSSNVLLGSDFEARLTDYCLTILTEDENPNLSGYIAPEIHGSIHEATPKSDVYSFGVLLLELLTGQMPSQHPYLVAKDMVRWMRSTRNVIEEENRLEMLLEVGIACRVKALEKRPTMWQVLRMLQEIKEAVLVDGSDLDDHECNP